MKLLTLFGVVLLFSISSTEYVSKSESFTTEMNNLQISRDYRFDYVFNEEAGGWLKFHEVPATWQEARLRCHSEGAVLASPLTRQVKDAITVFALEKKNVTSTTSTALPAYLLFTGVHATFSKGDYTSIEGVPLSRLSIAWAKGEPDNLNNSESCIVIDVVNMGLLADKRCDDIYPYICYKKEEALKIENECGTTDPGYKLEASTGSCYKVHMTTTTWARAFQTCVGEGGYLAVANSENEARILSNFTDEVFVYYYIGFHDWNTSGREWMTIHGETLSEAGYAVWSPGEPNNLTTYSAQGDNGEYCGSIDSHGFNDMPCHYPKPFICELIPGSTL